MASDTPSDYDEFSLEDLLGLAEAGDEFAQFELGERYSQGVRGALEDRVLAHVWYNLSAASGHEDAVSSRSALTNSMASELLGEAWRIARDWTAKSKVHYNPQRLPTRVADEDDL